MSGTNLWNQSRDDRKQNKTTLIFKVCMIQFDETHQKITGNEKFNLINAFMIKYFPREGIVNC